jgi:predicted GIY-YIG superfamily endonuclease
MKYMMKCMITALTSMALAPSGQVTSAPGATLSKSLKIYRAGQAYIRAVPATAVFGDKIIQAIVNKKPASPKSLMSLQGMGAKRLKCYGADILRLVSLHNKKKSVISAAASATAKKATKNSTPIPTSKSPRTKAIKVPRPRPRPRPRPKPKPKPKPNPRPDPYCAAAYTPVTLKSPSPVKGSSVYILELEDGKVYVGTSKDVANRLRQHSSGTGSAFTRAFKPTGTQLPRLGNVSGDGDAAERDETLRYMMLKGIPAVRGWKYSRVEMPKDEFDDAEANIRELYDLCRRCGYPGHFVSNCRMAADRWGQPCKCVK